MIPLLAVMLLAAPEETPRLRHSAYLAVLPAAERVVVRLTSIAHGAGTEALTWRYAFGGDGPQSDDLWVGLGEVAETTIDPAPQRLGAIWLKSGWSLAKAEIRDAAWAIIAGAPRQCTIIGEGDFRLYLPAGKSGALSVGASVTREGCRVRLSDGERVLADETGDFDQPKLFRIPPATEARIIRLEILPTQTPGLNLDDVELVVTEGFAPYLAPSAEFAEKLGTRWVAWHAEHPSS